MLAFIKRYAVQLVSLVCLTVCIPFAIATLGGDTNVAPAPSERSFVVKDADDLFKLKGESLSQVENFIVTETGSVFSERIAVVSFAEQNEVHIYPEITYSAFDYYYQMILTDHIKANPGFAFSVRKGLTGVADRVGVAGDPISTIAKQKAGAMLDGLGSMVVMLVLVGAMFGMMLYAQTGMLANKIDMVKANQLKDEIDELVGMDDIKRELLQLEEMVNKRDLYKEYGVDKPFNVMLTGPAGTGKTKIARCLAKRLNAPMFYTSAASLESGYVGGGAKTLKKLYKRAVRQKRAIIFLDEAESILMTRSRETHTKYENDSSTTLLSLLDGVNTRKNVEIIWIVASNFDEHKMKMDEAMLRRFSLKINFRLPNHEERREILSRLLSKRSESVLGNDIDLDHVAGITAGMSPAILESLVARASLDAVQGRVTIDQKMLLQAFERVAVGLTDRAATDKKTKARQVVAVHEAGHFIMQVDQAMRSLNGDISKLRGALNVIKISTESVSKIGALGFVLSKSEDNPLQTRKDYENKVCELYGGMANEELHYGEAGVTAGAHNDIQKVTALLDVMFNQVGYYQTKKINYNDLKSLGMDIQHGRIGEIESKAAELYRQTMRTLEEYRELTQTIVDMLMDRYVMHLDEVMPSIEDFYARRIDLAARFDQANKAA